MLFYTKFIPCSYHELRLNEFKTHLPEKSFFYIPENIEMLIAEKGTKNRYDQQKNKFKTVTIEDEKLSQLIQTIHCYKKGLDQKIFINMANRNI